MPKIACSAHSCVYNAESCCSLTNVAVGGSGAKRSCDTCCDSFVEGGARNDVSAECPCSFTDVDCAAKKCVYNHSGACGAASILVSGMGACNCAQTECETFRK